MAGETWAPTLADVARHVPRRTRDTTTPGTDKMLGTFTSTTTPDDEAAQGFADDSVKWVTSSVGELPANLPATDDVMVQARTAASYRAAADIELAYPNRTADVQLAAQLDQRAKDALADLVKALATDQGGFELFPEWNSPGPSPWADQNFDMPLPGAVVSF